ncbi:hypothetical protein Tco_0991821 [Tanacetum coccineum]|uniref:Uncharacterized protein n=1 Tax=Tanacetum coccineum TaxID=301880 RepID=A0ABQ5F1V0_9ASTR
MKSCESYSLEEVFKVFGNKRNYRFLGPVGYGSYSAFSVYSDPNLYYSKFRNMADVAGSWGQKELERSELIFSMSHYTRLFNLGILPLQVITDRFSRILRFSRMG